MLIAERKRKGLSLEQFARAVAHEMEIESISKQSVSQWETGRTAPRVDQFAAWATVMGLRLEVDLIRDGEDAVAAHLPSRIAAIARSLVMLRASDLDLVSGLVDRLLDDRQL